MSQVETESTSPRRPRGPLHRLDGRPLDHLDRCQAWSPPSETFKSWHRRKSFVKIGPTPYLMAAFRNLYKVISRQLDLPLAFLCYSQNKWLPELLTASDTLMLCLYYSNKTDLVFVLLHEANKCSNRFLHFVHQAHCDCRSTLSKRLLLVLVC